MTLALVITTAPAAAQTRPDTDIEQTPGTMLWTSAAFNSRAHSRLPHPTYRDFFLLGLRRSWPLRVSRNIAFDYTVDAVPIALTTDVPDYTYSGSPCGSAPCTAPIASPRATWHTAYGVGIAPLGAQVRLFPLGHVQGFASGSGGLLWFTRPIPDPDATRLNFTAQFSAGIAFRISPSKLVLAGYQFHHTSNGNTGRVNPGLNSHMIYLAIAPLRRR